MPNLKLLNEQFDARTKRSSFTDGKTTYKVTSNFQGENGEHLEDIVYQVAKSRIQDRDEKDI